LISCTPSDCAMHPLTIDEGVFGLAEDSEMYVSGGTCNRPNPGKLIPVFELFDVETKLVLGEAGYAELAEMLKRRAAG
jgi:hypothetical protein